MRALFLWFSIILVSNGFSANIAKIFDLSDLEQEGKETVVALAQEVEQLLPEKFKSKISEKFILSFRPLNKQKLTPPHCNPLNSEQASQNSIFYGRLNRFAKKIIIERQLLSWYGKREPILNCIHGSLHKMLLAAIIHEIFHAYDQEPFEREKELLRGCPARARHKNKAINKRCQLLRVQWARRRKISGDIVFQNQSFWSNDKKSTRILSHYENHNIAKYAAVNFEHFILDKEYKCRRPLQYRYFSKEFEYTPFQDHQCSSSRKVSLTSISVPNSFVTIDSKRVYQIQYLLADKGEGIAAGFGHSMIRLVICAPEHRDHFGRIILATPVGPQCLLDVDHHLVLSFRADTGLTVDMARGFFGGYPSVLFIIPFSDIINEYAKVSMRNLYSFPIQYSEEQKNIFIANMFNIHWEYRGNYKFFSRNCASETMRILTSVIDDINFHLNRPIKPHSVLATLVQLGLVDKKYKEDDFKNLDAINIVKSNEYYLKIAYKNVFPDVSNITRNNLFQYIEKKAIERRPFLEELALSERSEEWRKQVASFLILEQQAQRDFNFSSLNKLTALWLELVEQGELSLDMSEIMGLFEKNSLNTGLGYGIPQENEREIIEKKFISMKERTSLIADLLKTDVNNQIKTEKMRDFEHKVNLFKSELEEISNNIRTAQEMLK